MQFQNGSKIPDKTLVGCVKNKSTVYEIFRFFRFLIKKLLHFFLNSENYENMRKNPNK